MNQLASIKIWEVYSEIHSKTCSTRNNLTFFVDAMTLLTECNERLHITHQHFFGDVIIDFEKVMICENKQLKVSDYLVKAKIINASSYLPL